MQIPQHYLPHGLGESYTRLYFSEQANDTRLFASWPRWKRPSAIPLWPSKSRPSFFAQWPRWERGLGGRGNAGSRFLPNGKSQNKVLEIGQMLWKALPWWQTFKKYLGCTGIFRSLPFASGQAKIKALLAWLLRTIIFGCTPRIFPCATKMTVGLTMAEA